MSVHINNFTLDPAEFRYLPGKPEQTLKIEWSESFSNPGPNKGHYHLTISEDADVELVAIYIPEMDEEVTIEDFDAAPHNLPYILEFTPKSLIWYEDTESSNDRWMEVYIIITKSQSGEEGCEAALEVRGNYVPGSPLLPTLPASGRAIFKYQ